MNYFQNKLIKICVVLVLSCGFAGPAFALSSTMAPEHNVVSKVKPMKKPIKDTQDVTDDFCKSFLKHQDRSEAQSQNMGHRWQQVGRQDAALGLIVGLKFALNSTRKKNVRAAVWNRDKGQGLNRNVQAISAYRKCQNERLLK